MPSAIRAIYFAVPPGIERDGVDLNPRIPTGKPLRLSCDVKGKPPPAVKWYINDTLVDESFENVVLGPDWIEVFNVSLADKGIYKCAAENAAGSDEVAFKVDVNRKVLAWLIVFFFNLQVKCQ